MDIENLMKQLQQISEQKNLNLNIPETNLIDPPPSPTSIFDMDKEYKNNKLKGWTEIQIEDININDHIRVTSNRYKQAGRTCSHLVVQDIKNDEVYVNSYGQKKYPDWKLQPNNSFKQQMYYIRNEQDIEHTGFCTKCHKAEVPEGIYLCTYCRYNR